MSPPIPHGAQYVVSILVGIAVIVIMLAVATSSAFSPPIRVVASLVIAIIILVAMFTLLRSSFSVDYQNEILRLDFEAQGARREMNYWKKKITEIKDSLVQGIEPEMRIREANENYRGAKKREQMINRELSSTYGVRR